MADIQYKKGELLFEVNVTTSDEGGYNIGTASVPFQLTQDILIINFNEVEYTCEAQSVSSGIAYGDINTATQESDFTKYPFVFLTGDTGSGEYEISLVTENPGTHSLKIYTAVEDSDSTESNPVITYLMTSPSNTNWNVLSTLLGDGDWSQLKAYVETTPKNMNRQVLKVLLGSGSSGSSAVVGTAVVGTDTVG